MFDCSRRVFALLLTLVLGTLALGGRAGATTYYVDLAGTDGAVRSGSSSQPFRTLYYASTRAVTAGDMIQINAGTFQESIMTSLSPGVSINGAGQSQTTVTCVVSPTGNLLSWLITMGSWNADTPVAGNQSISNLTFDGSAHTIHQAIGTGARSNLTFQNLTFQNFSLNGLQISGSYTPFLSANAHWPDTLPPDSAYCTNIQVLHCTFLNGAEAPTGVNWAYGDIGFVGVKDSVIRNCTFDETSYGGWGIKGSWFKNSNVNNCSLRVKSLVTTRDNFSIEIWYAYNSQLFDNWATGAFSIGMNTNVRIHHNEIICPTGETASYAVEFGGYSSMVDHNWFDSVNGVDVWGGPYSNCTIAHNVFRNGTSAIFTRSADGTLGAVSNLHVYNNTLDNCGTLYNGGPISLNAQGANLLSGTLIKNNIVANTTVTRTSVTLGGQNLGDTYASYVNGTVVTNNLFYNNAHGDFSQTASVVGTVSSPNTVANPLFKGGSYTVPSPYYALQSGSPALGAGVDVGLPYLGTAPDLGAFVQQIGQRIEAEMNYSTAVDTGATGAVAVDTLNYDSNKCVRLPDSGDSIRIHFKVLTAGYYNVAARVRSGSWTVATNSDHNPTGMFSNYAWLIDGDSASFTGDVSSLSAPDPSGGGVYWGTMRCQNVYLTSGLHDVQISMAAAGGIADYLEVTNLAATTTYTWTGTTTPQNWSGTTNWDSNGIPASDVTNSLVALNPGAVTLTSKVDSSWNGQDANSINSLTFSTGTLTLTNGGASTNLTIGSGGFTNASTNNAVINFANVTGGTVTASGSQAWNINTVGTNNKGLTFSGNLVADNAADVLTVNYGAVNYTGITFSGVYTTPYSGSLQTGAANGTAQTYFGNSRSGNYDRVANLVIDNASANQSQRIAFDNVTNNNNVTTNITFQNFLNSSDGRAMIQASPGNLGNPFGSAAVPSVHLGLNLNFTGNWSGALVGKTTGHPQYPVIDLGNTAGAYTLSGNNSALTIDVNNVAQNKTAIDSQAGYLVLNHANALGTGNVLGVNIGQSNSATPFGRDGLLATTTAGIVSSDVSVNGNSFTANGASAQPGFACVGLLPTAANTDTVTFNGNVYSRGYGYAQNTIRFVTGLVNDSSHGGTLIHNGNIQDLVTYGYGDSGFTVGTESPVQYLGTGTFQVNGANVYVGDTSIRSGTVLAGDNASAGFAIPVAGVGGTMPKVGAAASTGATSITLNSTPGTAGLYVGQPVGNVQFGFAPGTRITSITGNVIGLSHPLIANVGINMLIPAGGAFGFHNSAISLGDNVPAAQNVKAATPCYNVGLPGGTTWSAGVFTFTGSNGTTYDGQALSVGDLVLVWGQYASTERNGVYQVTDSTHWTRASGWDTTTAMLAKMGSRVHVTNGNTCAGFDFELAPVNINTGVIWTINSPAGTGAIAAPVVFVPDVGNPNVAILTNGAYTIARAINVTNNQSTGKSTLGGNTADASTFSGLVTLSKNVSLTAAASGMVTFSGDITGSNNVTKEGLGTVKLTTAKSYTGTTSVTAGTLEVDNALASSGVTVGSGCTIQGTGNLAGPLNVTGTGIVSPGTGGTGTMSVGSGSTISGHLAVNVDDQTNTKLLSSGTINLAGATLDFTVGGGGFTQPYYVIAQGSSITGAPSMASGYTLTNTGTQLRLGLATHSISGTVTRSGSGLSGVTVSDGTRATTTDGSGAYTITSVPDSATYTVTPSLTGYTFAPASLSVTLSGSDVTGKDFAVAKAYGNWATIHGLSGADAATTANPSHDGLSNLVKYALDLNPAVSAQPAGTHSGNSLSFTKGAMAKADGSLTYSIEESTDLVTWGAPSLGSSTNGADTISYTFPSGQPQVFARLKVIQTP